MQEVGEALGELLTLPFKLVFGDKAHPLDAREVALREAAHGAAMIALPVVAYVDGMGAVLPRWFPLVALAVMFCGCLKLFKGAKFSIGWRDPELISAALVKVGIGVAVYLLVWKATTAWVPRWLLYDIAYFLYMTWPYGHWAVVLLVWWCLVTGTTKLVLVMRGFPALPLPDPGMEHGTAGFSKPGDEGFKL